MDRLRLLGVPETGLLAILTLYETPSGHIHTLEGLSNSILSTIRMKQGCSLSPTLFSFILENIDPKLGYLFYSSWVPILLFEDDIVLLSHLVEDLQGLIDTLDAFSVIQELVVTLARIRLWPSMFRKPHWIKSKSCFVIISSRPPPPTPTWEYSSWAPT